MMELWHDVCGCGWERGEEEIARRRGAVGEGTYYSYKDLVRAWVDICAGRIEGEVVAAGACVGYCRVLWGKEGGWGRATGMGRRTIFSIKCAI